MGDLPESEVSIPELSDLTRKWHPAVIAQVATAGAGGNATGGKTTIPEEEAGAV